MTPKRSIDDIDVRGLRVLVRLDLNVPLSSEARITDDRRIRAALPTVRKLIDAGGRLILMSHLGRPSGDPEKDKRLSLQPVARRFGELLGKPVRCIEWEAERAVVAEVRRVVDELRDGDRSLLRA